MPLLRRYYHIFSAFWQRGLTYRSTIIGYRIGEITELLVIILLWSRIFEGHTVILGYTKPEMITYFLLGNLFGVAVRSYARESISRDISEGGLSAIITKPMSYLSFLAPREIGRMSLPTILSIITNLLVILPFHALLIDLPNLGIILIIIAMLALALIIEFLINYLIGFITFWTEETEAIFDVIGRLKRFFSGYYFPLSLMPVALITLSGWMPFSYSFFTPAQLYLGKMSITDGLRGLGIEAAWIVILWLAVKLMYKRGRKRYEGVNI